MKLGLNMFILKKKKSILEKNIEKKKINICENFKISL
jgi:hypothetical protein